MIVGKAMFSLLASPHVLDFFGVFASTSRCRELVSTCGLEVNVSKELMVNIAILFYLIVLFFKDGRDCDFLLNLGELLVQPYLQAVSACIWCDRLGSHGREH